MVTATDAPTRRTWGLLAVAILVALIAGWLLFGGGLQAVVGRFVRPTIPGEVGRPAPAFTAETTAGQRISLADFRGRVVLINFWATWCAPCRAEMPEIEAAYQAHRGRGFEVVAINVQEGPAEVQPFMAELGLSFPALLDQDGTITRRYLARALPSTYLVDRNGVVSFSRLGPVTREMLEEQLAKSGL
jgi:thiol-disulfide isomerase/thioredoxin